MGKKILITSTDLMMIQFLVPHVKNLAENGFDVDIACSEVGGRLAEVKKAVNGYVKTVYQVRLHRSPANLENIKGYRDMKRVINKGNYDLIWTNEPVMGVVTRLASISARKNGTKVLYMTHGFHFQKGGSIKYWLAFYPIELLMSIISDEIVTINKEDYNRAKKMFAKEVKYIHGIGVNPERLHATNEQHNIREELNIPEESFIVLSVGELNSNKNQQVIIKAISLLKDPSIHYILCGKGVELEKLEKIAAEKGISKQVHFLGYRTDVVDICSQADVFAFPSYREGLGLAPLEAMYSGLPLVTSNRRGPSDFMENGKTGYMCAPDDYRSFARAIRTLKNNRALAKGCANYNRNAVKPYLLDHVKSEIVNLFVQKADSYIDIDIISNRKKHKISVLMGIYNCSTTLPDAIESILKQTYDDWELIMCDDGSTDDTLAVAKTYEHKYPDNILVLKNDKNRGLNYTLNHCLKYATGEYIARMDGDDICDSERFQIEIDSLENEPDIAIVSTDMNFFDETGTWGLVQHPDYPSKEDFIHESPFCHAPCMVRKEAFDAVGGYSEETLLLRVEDYHLWYKMYLAGFRGKNIHKPLYSMRDDRAAYSRRKFKYRINEAYVKWLIATSFKLPLSKYIYISRPIIVGLLPNWLYNVLHKNRLRKEK